MRGCHETYMLHDIVHDNMTYVHPFRQTWGCMIGTRFYSTDIMANHMNKPPLVYIKLLIHHQLWGGSSYESPIMFIGKANVLVSSILHPPCTTNTWSHSQGVGTAADSSPAKALLAVRTFLHRYLWGAVQLRLHPADTLVSGTSHHSFSYCSTQFYVRMSIASPCIKSQ